MTESTRVATLITPWIEAAVSEHKNGEEVRWEIGVVPIPGPDGTPEPAVCLLIWIPGPVLGTTVSGACPIHNPVQVDEEFITGMVTEFLRHLREGRSRALAAAVTQAGQSPNGSGLILP